MYKGKHQLLIEKIEEINNSDSLNSFIFNFSDLVKVGNKEYRINSTELKTLINKVIKDQDQSRDIYVSFDTIYFKNEPKEFTELLPLRQVRWLLFRKDLLYESAKTSLERYGRGMLSIEEPNLAFISSLKKCYPDIFSFKDENDNDISERIMEEIYQVEKAEELGVKSELMDLLQKTAHEISDKQTYIGDKAKYFLSERELGFEYLELFFNDTCNCEEPSYYSHLQLTNDCLKTKEQIIEFRDKVFKIMDNKIEELLKGEKNESSEPIFSNYEEYSKSKDLKSDASKKINDKITSLGLKYSLFIPDQELRAESGYKSCFDKNCSHSDLFVKHIWDCLKEPNEITKFKDKMISFLEQHYLEKSKQDNNSGLSLEEIREKIEQERNRREQENNEEHIPLNRKLVNTIRVIVGEIKQM